MVYKSVGGGSFSDKLSMNYLFGVFLIIRRWIIRLHCNRVEILHGVIPGFFLKDPKHDNDTGHTFFSHR